MNCRNCDFVFHEGTHCPRCGADARWAADSQRVVMAPASVRRTRPRHYDSFAHLITWTGPFIGIFLTLTGYYFPAAIAAFLDHFNLGGNEILQNIVRGFVIFLGLAFFARSVLSLIFWRSGRYRYRDTRAPPYQDFIEQEPPHHHGD